MYFGRLIYIFEDLPLQFSVRAFFINIMSNFSVRCNFMKISKKSNFPMRKCINGVYIVFSIFCIVSIISELIYKHSLLGNCISCPPFLRANVILEIMKIIGFSNIFLSILYSNLSKKMLAISYEDILKDFSPKHNKYTILHIICNLACFALATGGLSESALAMFILVLNGFIYQWNILYYIVFNSNKCEKLAIDIWEHTVQTAKKTQENQEVQKSKKEQGIPKNNLFDDLCLLAETLPERSCKYYGSHIKCFAKVLSIYACGDIDVTKIKELSAIWQIILKNENADDMLEEVSNALFYNFNSDDKSQEILCNVFTAYMFCKLCSNDKNNLESDFNAIFKTLINDMRYFVLLSPIRLSEKLKHTYLLFVNCWQTNIHILAWAFFQQGMLPLSKDIFDIVPDEKNLDYKYAEQLTRAYFLSIGENDEHVDKILDIAKQQLNGRLKIEVND